LIVRKGEFLPALGLIIGLNFAVGIAWAYIGEYKMLDLPPGIPAHAPSFSRFLMMLSLYSLISLGVVALPFVLRGIWVFGNKKISVR
jgi:hypothetical protein